MNETLLKCVFPTALSVYAQRYCSYNAIITVKRVRCVAAASNLVRAEVHDTKLTRYGQM